MRLSTGFLAFASAILFAGSVQAEARRSVTYTARTMGTTARVVLVTADSTASAPLARVAAREFARIDSLMSNWTTTSEVARINREAARSATPVEPEVARVIAASLDVGQATGGAFDITVEPLVRVWGFIGGPPRVPTPAQADSARKLVGLAHLTFDPSPPTIAFDRSGVRIDLGGIAKGYAVDVVAESLKARGVSDALVDLSGNMFPLGHPEGSDSWRIGVRDPRDRIPYFARLPLRGKAIASSGNYEQFVAAGGKKYGHIMDPRTGEPADGLLGVTVLAPTAMAADAWDTPLFVLGPVEARRIAKQRSDIDVLIIEPGPDGRDIVWVEESLRDRFVLEPEANRFFRVEYY
ncbi:MAG: FAD:protein FMN transferase [Candidatus Eiseniibacteriota bacterium]